MQNLQPFPIADLHCDLLCYLHNHPSRTAHDPAVRCSIPQLREGNVKIQIMAIFTETESDSSQKGFGQGEIFKMLPKIFPEDFRIVLDKPENNDSQIQIIPSLENGSAFCEEEGDLKLALKQLDSLQRKVGKLLYVSLTWNTENRFGGGAHTSIGLKEDGKELIRYMSQRNIALDISHASDHLAYDCLNFIDKERLPITVLASHSNFRNITNAPRNLPDDIAKEIIRRDGIIGLNFVRFFVGENSPNNFVRQLEHALSLNAEKNICFGADFFYGEDVSQKHRSRSAYFFPSYDHAGTYPKVLDLWRSVGGVSETLLRDICFDNLHQFLLKRM